MFDDGYKFIPVDKKFVNETNTSELTLGQIAQIRKCRRDFYREFYTLNKDQRFYMRLANKANFIYQWSEGHGYKRKGDLSDIALVESILSDRGTLFSAEYLNYEYNHATLAQLGKNDRDEECVSFALISAPSKWEAPFKDTLEELMKRAHREKKPLMAYYRNLRDYYYQTEDAEKLIALNSLVRCNQPDSDTGLDPDDIITYLLDVLDQCCEWEKDNKKSFPEFAPEEMYRDFVSAAMMGRISPEREILNDVSDQLLERMQREKKSATEYDEILSNAYKKAKSEISSAVLGKIKKWYPDTSIEVDAAIYFLRHVLENCANHERDIKAMKGLLGAGNFSPTYTAQDAQKAKIYIARKNQLKSLREKLESWIKTHEFPFYRETFGVEGDECGKFRISDKRLSKVTIHLRDYIVNSRSRVHELSTDNVHKIINQLSSNRLIDEQVSQLVKQQSQNNKQSPKPNEQKLYKQIQNKFKILLPFRLLVLCTIGKGGIFADKSSLAGNSLEESLKKVCSKDTWKSRYQCLLLLFNLCKDFNLKKKGVEENLLYFIKYYGILIRSDKESKLWDSAIGRNKLFGSPASLGLRYYNNLKECFPLHLESLFCYESCSALHLGGFHALTQAFPELVEHYYYRYRYNNKVLKEICREYIHAWPNEKRSQGLKDGEVGRDAIKEICHKSIKSLKWDELNKTKDWIEQWNWDSKNGHFRSSTPIDMKELRALFAEITISGIIARESRKYLSQQIQSYYSSLNETEIN